MKIVLRLVAIVLAGLFFGAVATWAAGNSSLNDGQYIGYPLLAAMISILGVAEVWLRTSHD